MITAQIKLDDEAALYIPRGITPQLAVFKRQEKDNVVSQNELFCSESTVGVVNN